MTSIHLLNLSVFVCACGWQRIRERRIDRQQLARPDKILSLIMRGPCPIWDRARAGQGSQHCRCHMSELALFTILSNFSPVRSFSGLILSGSGAVSRPVWCGDYRTPFMFPVGWQWQQNLCGQEEPGSSVYIFGFLIYRANYIQLHRYNDTKIMLFHVCFIISNPRPCYSFYSLIWYSVVYYHILFLFIQSDLRCFQSVFYQYVFFGNLGVDSGTLQ